MPIEDEMKDVQQLVVNQLGVANGLENTVADGQITPAKLSQAYLPLTGGSVSGNVTVSSGTSGDAKLIIEADTDNNNDDDNPFIILKKDGGLEESAIWSGTVETNSTTNDNSLNLASGTTGIDPPRGGIKFLTFGSATNAIERYKQALVRMVVSAAGNVGIGTDTPAEKLEVIGKVKVTSSDTIFQSGAGNAPLRVGGVTGYVGIDSNEIETFGDDLNVRVPSQKSIFFQRRNNDSDASATPYNTHLMTIRHTGRVGIGETEPDEQLTIRAGDYANNQNGGIAVQLGAAFSGGNTANHFKGAFKLKTNSSGVPRTVIERPNGNTGGTQEALVIDNNGNVGIAVDDAVDLGSSSFRFDDIYATNGTIQTSDANDKQDIEELSEAEQRVAVACKGLLRKFRWKSAVEEKGEEARIHFGIIAQDLQAAFEAEGLDAGRYGMFISSTWTDEETGEDKTRLGVRYSELLAFIISAI